MKKGAFNRFFFCIQRKDAWISLGILLLGFLLTYVVGLSSKSVVEKTVRQDFELVCNEIKMKIDARLKAHAQLLRSGAAYIDASDTVTREEWKKFNINEKIEKNLPGILGVGYSVVIPKDKLADHEVHIRQSGFPEYKVYPRGNRDMYSSIVYLEPFEGRNLEAFGYDMYSEPVRRKAMQIACDSNYAMLSGKVLLVQEIDDDVQAGNLMYVPVYMQNVPIQTVEQRRAALKGWVYSPYRMDDLLLGILGSRSIAGKNQIRLSIYDGDKINKESLLFDSQKRDSLLSLKKVNLEYVTPIVFNDKKWKLVFQSYNAELSFFHGKVWIIIISGLAISMLLFALSIAYLNTRERARQIEKLNQQLEVLVSDKDRFISILSHDLRSPFNALLGFTELLATNLHKYSYKEIESHLKIINESEIQIFNLLENILLWTRSQAGKMKYNPQKLVCSDLCSEVIENMAMIAKNKEVELRHHLNNGPIEVFADKEMVKTILRNLIANAIKFTYKGGLVDVFFKQTEAEVIITVADNGVGMEPGLLDKIFDGNEIQSTEGTSNERGTGFGLKLCRFFVEQNNGRIWAESTPGKGSAFHFTLMRIDAVKEI